MRIDIVIAGFGQGGAQRQCAWLANALADRADAEVRLLHFLGGPNRAFVDDARVEVVRLETASLYRPSNAVRLARLLRARRPDIVFSWQHAADVAVGLARPLLPRRTRWVMAERDSSYPADWRFELRRRVGRGADAIAANSEKGKDYWVASGCLGARVHVVDNILSPGIGNVPRGERRFDVLYAGRLEAQKNVEVLAEAFCLLAARRPELRLGIVGDGSRRARIEEIVATHGMTGRVALEPYDPDILRLFRSNPVFVNPSRHEGLPNTVIENVACGNRIVASRIPEHVAVLGEAYPDFLEAHEDPAAIAAHLDRACGEAWDEAALGPARARLRSMTPERVAARHVDLFQALMNQT